MLVTLKEILCESISRKYAVGAFDTMDEVTTEAILAAAEEKGVPVILMIVAPSLNSPDAEHFMDNLINRAKKSPIPVCVHLDHSPTYEDCMKGIRYGCTSVMIDASSLPYEENVALTKKVVEAAHACGVSVEGEIGHVSGHEGNMLEGNVADESAFTTVKEAEDYYHDTGIDAIAVAVGTVHGVYKGEPHLNFERLQELRDKLPIPIVIHGGSGLPEEDYTRLVEHGANKINFFTAMSLAGGKAVQAKVSSGKKITFLDVVLTGKKAEQDIVAKHIALFQTQPLRV